MTTTPDRRRTCVGCRTVRPVGELVRLRLTAAGISPDTAAHGRGAWLCAGPNELAVTVEPTCLADAVSSRAFDRAFRRRIAPQLIDDLRRRMSVADDGGRSGNRR